MFIRRSELLDYSNALIVGEPLIKGYNMMMMKVCFVLKVVMKLALLLALGSAMDLCPPIAAATTRPVVPVWMTVV